MYKVDETLAPQGFIAVYNKTGSCVGCYFNESGKRCPGTPCSRWKRSDQCHVIFIKKDNINMCKYTPLNTIEELVAAKQRGDTIEQLYDSSWKTWDGRYWDIHIEYRAIQQPKVKTITFRKAVFLSYFGYHYTEDVDILSGIESSDSFVKWIEGSEYTVEVPVK